MSAPAEPLSSPFSAAHAAAAARGLVTDLQRWAVASDTAGAYPHAEMDALREAGLLLAPVPTVHGGGGLGHTAGTQHALLTVLRSVGRGSLPAGRLYEGHVNALHLIARYGTGEQQRRAAEDAASGHLFGVWNTEAKDGVTLAPTPGGGLRLSGAKTFCSGALPHESNTESGPNTDRGQARRDVRGGDGWAEGRRFPLGVTRPLVNGAMPDGAWQMTLVPMERAVPPVDPSWWQAEGMRASASARVDFTGVEVGPEGIIGAPGDYLREPMFNGGAIRFAAVHLGGADALLAATVGHLTRLDRLGSEAQRLRLGAMATAVETGALWLLGAARLAEDPDVSPGDLVAYVRLARCAVERACLDVMEGADRATGAAGIGRPGVLERIGRDLRLYLRQPNPDGALMGGALHVATHPGAAWGSRLSGPSGPIDP